MAEPHPTEAFALCVENKDCPDLEKRKIYVVMADRDAEKDGGGTACWLLPRAGPMK